MFRVVILGFFVIIPILLQSQNYKPDSTFGQAGSILLPACTNCTLFLGDLFTNSGGNITLLTDYDNNQSFFPQLYEYTEFGDPNTSFGNNGVVNVRYTPDTNLIIFRTFIKSIQTQDGGYLSSYITNKIPEHYILHKVTALGQDDVNFNQNGFLDFGTLYDFTPGNFLEVSDGYIILARDGREDVSRFYFTKLLYNGTVDSSFGHNGLSYFKPFGNDSLSLIIEFDNPMLIHNNSLYLVCNSYYSEPYDKFLDFLKFDLNGKFDSSFADNGRLSFHYPTHSKFVHLLPSQDKKLILIGYHQSNFPLIDNYFTVKVDTNGAVDNEFTFTGPIKAIMDNPTYERIFVVYTDNEFNIWALDNFKNIDPTISTVDFYKLKPDGTADENFARSGKFVTDLYKNNSSYYKYQVTEDQNILIAENQFYDDETSTIRVYKYIPDKDVKAHTIPFMSDLNISLQNKSLFLIGQLPSPLSCQLKIFNNNGTICFSNDNVSLSVGNNHIYVTDLSLLPGMYYCTIYSSEGNTKTFKLLVPN